MRNYILMFEYNLKMFMDINKIIEFKNNINLLRKNNKNVKIVFYGETSNEAFATLMGYFNNLVGENICDMSISFKTKEIIIENGINNKSIKLSAKNAKEIKEKRFDNLVKEYYSSLENMEIKVLPTKDWQKLILDFIES